MADRLKKVSEKDKDILFKWVNDEMCRKNSFHSHEISYGEHCEWFEKKLSDPMCYMFLLYCDDDQIGQIRIDCDGEIGCVSYFVAFEYRGQGHGDNIIRLIEKEMYGKIKKIVSYVKYDNVASQHVFINNNYNEKKEDNYLKYEKEITVADNISKEFISGGDNCSYE